MNALRIDDSYSPEAALRDLVGRFGFGATLLAFGRILLRGRPPARPQPAETLPDWLRKDIGLPPLGDDPPRRGLAARPGPGGL